MDWMPIGLIALAALMIADLSVFRFVFTRGTAENVIMRVVNGAAWTLAVVLLLFGFAWAFI